MSISNILVLGAGELGTAILHSLASKAPPSTKVSVLLRPSAISTNDPAKKALLKDFSDRNISLVSGDVVDLSTAELAATFKPFDLVISALGFISGPGLQIKLTQAALDAKIKRYIPWQFGIDYDVLGRGSAQPVFDEQLDVRDLIRSQSAVEWIIVATGIFTSFLFEEYYGVVVLDDEKGGTVRALGGWENSVTVTTPEDIGKLTADIIFTGWEQVKNSVVYVAGETVTYGKIKDVVEKVLNVKLSAEVWTVDTLREDLRKDPGNPIRRYRVVFGEGKGVAWEMERTWNSKKGIDMVDAEEFFKNKYESRTQLHS